MNKQELKETSWVLIFSWDENIKQDGQTLRMHEGLKTIGICERVVSVKGEEIVKFPTIPKRKTVKWKKDFGEGLNLGLILLWDIPTVFIADASFRWWMVMTQPFFYPWCEVFSAMNRDLRSSQMSCVALVLPFFHTFPSVFTSNPTMNTTKNNYCRYGQTYGRRHHAPVQSVKKMFTGYSKLPI